MGIRTVMVTGDNPTTAASIASEAGVDDSLPRRHPKDKLRYIRDEQTEGRLIAMCGGAAPTMRRRWRKPTSASPCRVGRRRRARPATWVDLDSNPTKLIEIVGIGKQLLMTRGTLHYVLHRQ